MIYRFRAHIHPLSESATTIESVNTSGRTLALEGQPASFHVTFDRASEILATLPRMFIEPDGSFVWTGDSSCSTWQLDGVLYDEGPHLAFVEVSGCCPANEFDQLLAALGWPAAPVMFQQIEAGVYVDEMEFRRLASRQLES